MPSRQLRKVAMLLTSTVAVALTAITMIPGFGLAQEATPANVSQAQEESLLETGSALYSETCIACHQAGGTGAESAITFTYYPALAGDPFVTLDDPAPLINTVLFGRGGMPSFRFHSDEEIAGVLTYVRQSFGNDASAISPEQVASVRAQVNATPQAPATPPPAGELRQPPRTDLGTPIPATPAGD